MEKSAKSTDGFRQYLPLTFLIGFGFLTMGLMDPLYDTYVPLFLKRYIQSNAAIGGVMTLDNILQLLLIPIVSVWSDRTRTRIGRRMPFLVVMLPASALFFALIPDAAAMSFWALIAAIFCLNIFKTSVRGPVVALMPDTIPGDYRSEANGVISTMGGLGLILGTLGLARLADWSERAPFAIAAACVVGSVVVLLLFVKERTADDSAAEKREPILASLKTILDSSDKSVLRILIGIFFWFMAYEGAKPFLGLYLVEDLGASSGMAALAQGVAGISGVALAIPTGYLAHRFGRRNFIRTCLVGLAVILATIAFTSPIARASGFSLAGARTLFLILMLLYGAVWIGVVVNSFPMLWQMADYGNTGIYTGLYYLASQSAAIAAPPITGAIIDMTGFPGIFLFGALCMLLAWVSMGGVRKGEAAKGTH
jgi:MFS family permease